LETAIILIAFVTVASVLGYSVLSAGIFSSEKGKETVYQGLAQAQASMEVKGSVFANVEPEVSGTSDAYVNSIQFSMASVLNDEAVDMTPPVDTLADLQTVISDIASGSSITALVTHTNTTVINYTDSTGTYNDVPWTEVPLGTSTGQGSMLQPNEQMEIYVALPYKTTFGTGGVIKNGLSTYGTFSIQIVPATGAAITLERTLPGILGTSVDLN
jgi:archaellin